METNKRIVIFDICGTLYNSNTTMDFCEFRCENSFKKKQLKLSKSTLGKVLNRILVNFFNFDFIRIMHIKTLANVEKEELEKDAVRFVDFFLEFKKNIEVHTLLKSFDEKDLMLVSATIEPVAKAISMKLGNLEFLSTTLEYSENKSLGKIKNDLLGKKQKYFKGEEISFIITDNKSDLLLCQKAKKVVIVSKDKNLIFWNKQNLNISKIIKT